MIKLKYTSTPIRLPHYGSGFSRESINSLEIAALEALDHNLYFAPQEWSDFLFSLADWTFEKRQNSDFPATHHEMSVHLDRLANKEFMGGTPSMRRRQTTRPSSHSVCKVHLAVLKGFEILSSKLLGIHSVPELQIEWCPAADEVVQSYGRDNGLEDPERQICTTAYVHGQLKGNVSATTSNVYAWKGGILHQGGQWEPTVY